MFQYNDISFRMVEERDLKLLYEMRYDETVNEQLFDTIPISLHNQKAWMESMLKSKTSKVFVVVRKKKVKDEVIGCVKLRDIDHQNQRVEIGADILEEHRKKGYGTKTYEALEKYCFNYLNMQKMYLYVFESNQIAVNLYKKAGFEIEGRLKDHIYRNGWKTVLLMAKFRTAELSFQTLPLP